MKRPTSAPPIFDLPLSKIVVSLGPAVLGGGQTFSLTMKTSPLRAIATALTCLAAAHFAAAMNENDSVVTAVFSRSFNKYERPTRADGSDQPLTYVVAKGGIQPGMYPDESMDDVKFAGIVRVLGKYLAKRSYFPAKDAKKADLMLVVHWGKTKPFDSGMYQNNCAPIAHASVATSERISIRSNRRCNAVEPLFSLP